MGNVGNAISKLKESGIKLKDQNVFTDLAQMDYLLVDLQPWCIRGSMKVATLLIDGEAYDVHDKDPESFEFSSTIDRLITCSVVSNDAEWKEESVSDQNNIISKMNYGGTVSFTVRWEANGLPIERSILEFTENYREVDIIRSEWKEIKRIYLPFEDLQYRICMFQQDNKKIYRAFLTGALRPLLEKCSHSYYQGRLSELNSQKRGYLLGRGVKLELEDGQLIRGYAELELDFLPQNFNFLSDKINFPLGVKEDELSLLSVNMTDKKIIMKQYIFIGFIGLYQTFYEPSFNISELANLYHPLKIILISPSSCAFVNHYGRRLGYLTNHTHIEAERNNLKHNIDHNDPNFIDPSKVRSLVYEISPFMDFAYYDTIFAYKEIALAGVTTKQKYEICEYLIHKKHKVGVLGYFQKEMQVCSLTNLSITTEQAPMMLKNICSMEIDKLDIGLIYKAIKTTQQVQYHKG